jgi:aminoglycoside phosphotransferase (APT) family kinase protein
LTNVRLLANVTETSDRDDGNEPDPEAIAGMVDACAGWTLRGYERVDEGTDFVAVVDCTTPDGARTAVLKATTAGFVPPEVARAEPRLYRLVGRETAIPVPEVYGSVDDHGAYPTPFYLLEYVDGENVEGRAGALDSAARERLVREAGANLAALHELGPLPRIGSVGVEAGATDASRSGARRPEARRSADDPLDGDLVVRDGDHGPVEDFREWLRASAEETCDALADGTYFPALADEPDRFADLAEALRAELNARIDALSAPEPPRLCHWDYRYGNLLVDPDTGETLAVLDWANLLAAEPAYNLAKVETHLFELRSEPDERTAALRETFRAAYERGRDGWTFTDDVAARIDTYLLSCRTEAMACLPLWHEDATATEKTEREREHRAFVGEYL